METESGKLFVGGISWDTTEERLREYFQAYGEVAEAVIMKDRITGRARGFGFVVFSSASVAEKVLKGRHIIDGKAVEAKRAVPRDDQQSFNKSNGSSIQGSPSPARTKKIFVGGLPSTITESDFKKYFDQFGTITDVVVMYDQNTQRPRGFGFITFDSEETVNKVLVKTFHELNGKMVEVKVAVPKELSLGPTRSQPSFSNYGLNRMSSFLNAHAQGYNSTSTGSYGMRMDDRFGPASVGRSGFPLYSPSKYSMGPNLNSGFNINYGAVGDSGLGHARGFNPLFNGSPNRYSFRSDNGGSGSALHPSSYNVWGNENLSYGTNSVTSNVFGGSGNARMGGNFGTIGDIWDASAGSYQARGIGSLNHGNILNNYASRAAYVGNTEGAVSLTSHMADHEVHELRLENLYKGESIFGNHGWRPSSMEFEDATSLPYGHGDPGGSVAPNNPAGYIGDYTVMTRSNRGIAA